jgi:cyclase
MRARVLILMPMWIAGLIVIAGTNTAHSQTIDFDKMAFISQQVGPHLYTLTGAPNIDPGHQEAAGGRVAVLEGPDGIFMVDAQYAGAATKLLASVKAISPAPIRFLVNTHLHADHTGGNAAIAKTGALLIAREETRTGLQKPPTALAANATAPNDPARMPVLTFANGAPLKIRMDGEVLSIIPLPNAHTNGDAMIQFETANVLMVGDVYRSAGYPFADPHNGGSYAGIVKAVDVMLATADANTKVIPGHGEMVARAQLSTYREMIIAVQSAVQKMIDQGATKEQVLAAKVTSPFDAQVKAGLDVVSVGGPTSADRFVGGLFTELSQSKTK